MDTRLRVLSESYTMNTNMTGFKKSLHPCALDKSSLSIWRAINIQPYLGHFVTSFLNPKGYDQKYLDMDISECKA